MSDSGVGGCLNPDPVLIVPDVWEGLIAEYHPRTVLDVGCGYGHAVAWFLHHGIYAFGLDGYPPAIEKSMAPKYVALHDFAVGPTGGRLTYDLCWCAEFVEHVEEQYIPNYAECFTRCNILAMTHAIPGQPGDELRTYVNDGQGGGFYNISVFDGATHRWSPDLILHVGEGFWINKQQAQNWVRVFYIQ